MLGWLKEGLRDFSVSRAGGSWGIPFPGDPEHRIYVWFDALTNYVTGAGFPDDPAMFERFWPADLHVIGKNITRFHCLYWPAMLMSAGLPLPRQVFAHGFMLLRGEKMSKTRGNVLDPDTAVELFGVDGVRYLVLREIPFDRDADVTLEGWSAATTRTWPTTSATWSTAPSAWPIATWRASCRAWPRPMRRPTSTSAPRPRAPGRTIALPWTSSTWTRRWPP